MPLTGNPLECPNWTVFYQVTPTGNRLIPSCDQLVPLAYGQDAYDSNNRKVTGACLRCDGEPVWRLDARHEKK